MASEITIEEIVANYTRPIYGYVFRLVGARDIAEDLTQDIFIKIWKNLDRYCQDQSLKTWIFTIAHRTVIDWSRKKKIIYFSELDKNIDDESNNFSDNLIDLELLPDELFAQKELKEKLSKIIEDLPVSQREIIILRLEQDLTLEAIAQVLDRPINTVKSQFRRALIFLRKRLEMHPR